MDLPLLAVYHEAQEMLDASSADRNPAYSDIHAHRYPTLASPYHERLEQPELYHVSCLRMDMQSCQAGNRLATVT
jgi:hypothetical protein